MNHNKNPYCTLNRDQRILQVKDLQDNEEAAAPEGLSFWDAR